MADTSVVAEEIKVGFRTPWWEAIADAVPITFQGEPLISIHIRYNDGGTDYRYFEPGQRVKRG